MNIVQQELIGLRAEVEESSNRDMRGLCGVVVDETRNMLVLADDEDKEKRIPKGGNTFVFTVNRGVQVRVKGDMLVSRPEDRIKK